ncbi:MAG: diguanylate cyclase/phosphodiesterase (GGDEF & EAL domains) with PAS/PAC sensor(s) [uncultured Thermoleophilia bacterium]|uniref:Diguanylate cyclase/phosphodiesterase (GGDEF & EAL domains) with PAS/PAC sensor(S) n=1 Tax=uncultured Thermoleophilia bacterium TaxID=1497501 RepID=A0A6J4TZS9_9ACTN|nr:MAG: diguanylate cyclase/phosphodiesterase (GGDEF & EAL domains) with PAS/PAC sensor(s) [uncultured Thermoleophilia bacterium]
MPAVAIAAASAIPPRTRRPGAYVLYTAVVLAAGIVALLGAALLGEEHAWAGDGLFWTLAGMCLLGELLPVRLARGQWFDEITVSTAFAFAVLLAFGPLPAMVLYATASLVADGAARLAPVKVVFNASQYIVSIGAAAVVLHALTGTTAAPAVDGAIPAIALAGAALFAVNHVLAGVGAAILTRRPLGPYLRGDLGFHVWTSGFQLALAPVIVACAEVDSLLVPLLFLPVLAIFFGGRQAVINHHRALHDNLTNLPNRELFYGRLEELIEGSGGDAGRFAVLLADLDDFKAVNDSLGHHLGDELLRCVGRRLEEVAPTEAMVARLGGDEFAILLPGADAAAGMDVAHRILERLEQPVEVESFSLDVRASIGVAAYPGHGRDRHALLKHADLALYRAKDTRTRCECYSGHDESEGFDRLALAAELRRGIERDELVLHYQPKLALGADHADGVEALVRWQHPQLGLIGPDGFIPLAEQSNLIKPLTKWVLRAALAQCRAWRDGGLDLRVAVNLSTRSLLDRGLPAQIQELLAEQDLPAGALQVEVTETKIVADFGRARDVLQQLRSIGVRVAIDDFGTGYSSLAQLQQLPADEIKVDKSFVIDMETNSNNAAIVRSTIGLGRNLALDVTAEGVETSEARDRLVELGCDYAQGFFLGRPTPPEACERTIRAHAASRRFTPSGFWDLPDAQLTTARVAS